MSSAGKALAVLRAIVYIIIIAGAALWGYGLYQTRGQWTYKLASRPEISYLPPVTLRVKVPLEIYDPAGPVTAKLVYYQVYMNGYPVGSGLIPYINLEKGWNNLTVSVDIEITKVTCGLAHALANGENVTVSIKGYAMVDIKTFGGITFRTITVPFEKQAANVATPAISGVGMEILKTYDAFCSGKLKMPTPSGSQGGGFHLP